MDEHALPIGILTAGPGDAAEVARAVAIELTERLGPVVSVPIGPTAQRAGSELVDVASLAGLVVTGELAVDGGRPDVIGWLGPVLDALGAGVPVAWSGVRLSDDGLPAWAASLVREAVASSGPVTVADEASRRCLAHLGVPGAPLLPHWTKGRALPEAEVLAAHWDAFAERVEGGVASRAVAWADVLALLDSVTAARDGALQDLAVARETAAAEAAAHERTATAAAAALAAQTAAVEELGAALAAVRAQVAEERAERARLQQAVVERDAWIDATRRSASWRWTAPLRRLARLLRRHPEPIAAPVPLGRLTLVPAPAGDEPLRSAV